MADLNKVILIGRLARDPEKRMTITGNPVTRFTIAVNRLPDKDGNVKADFINIVVFGRVAESVSSNLTKGRQVCVEGRLHIREFTTQDGQRRREPEVIANNVQFLARPTEKVEEEAITAESVSEEEFSFDNYTDLKE